MMGLPPGWAIELAEAIEQRELRLPAPYRKGQAARMKLTPAMVHQHSEFDFVGSPEILKPSEA
jgi:hypothetical protein